MHVAFANLFCRNPWPVLSLRRLRAGHADLVALAEVAPARVDKIAAALPCHHLVLTVPTDRRCRLLLFSVWPQAEAAVIDDGPCAERPFGKARFEGPPAFTVFVAHPNCPLGQASRDRRDRQLARLAEEVSRTDGPVILLGDLNADHGSPALRPLLEEGSLLTPRSSGRDHPTWPWPWPRHTYDHVLHSSHFRCESVEAQGLPGSDHLGLRARLRWTVRGNKADP